jgi:hypothetical protein
MAFYSTLYHYWSVIIWGSIVVAIATALLVVGLIVLRRRGGRLLFLLMIMLTAMLAVSTARLRDSVVLTRQRSALAAELGVELRRWPWPTSFPVSYFFSVLEKGTPRREVHQIVRSYERVLRCGPDSRGFTQEVYYFYSDRDDKALRMQIEYDTQGHLYRVQGEDPNSRVFSVTNCQAGRWGE